MALKNIKKLISLISELRDIRVVGQLMFGVIALLVAWSSLGAIQTNYELQREISRRQQQNTVLELTNNNLELKNQYFETDQFLELEARRVFSKGTPGETLLLVPKSVALAHSTDLSVAAQQSNQTSESIKPFYQENFEAWVNFLFHRNIE